MTTAMTIPTTIDNGQITTLTSAKTGKAYGHRLIFGATTKAGDVKAALKLKDKTLKGAALTKQVNDVLSGRTTLAWAEYEASVSAMRSAGYQPDALDVRKAGATARFVKPAEPKSSVKSVSATITGMTAEEKAELLAFLTAPAAQAVINV